MKHPCDPTETALKSFFLGPQAENAKWVSQFIVEVFERWFKWRQDTFPEDGRAISTQDQDLAPFIENQKAFHSHLQSILSRFEAEHPKFSPRYISHMFSEISIPALFGHIVALLHNPNNLSGESAPVGIAIEKEAIGFLLEMIGFSPEHSLGHFTSGGTIANFEALVRARHRMTKWIALGLLENRKAPGTTTLFASAHMGWAQYHQRVRALNSDSELEQIEKLIQNPWRLAAEIEKTYHVRYEGPVLLIPHHRHYSWPKGISLLGLSQDCLWPIELQEDGRLSPQDLEKKIDQAKQENRPVLAVVSIAGTTELGIIDPIDEVSGLLLRLRDHSHLDLWHHVDAAYGGFFCSIGSQSQVLVPSALRALQGIRNANSVTIDPHKLGYVPYSSGAFLTRDFYDYVLPKVDAPYLHFDEKTDRGLMTLEGSRSAAGATATWLTAKNIGLHEGGYGKILERTIRSRVGLERLLKEKIPDIHIAPGAETNIMGFCIAKPGENLSAVNRRTQKLYQHYMTSKKNPFFVSKTELKLGSYPKYLGAYLDPLNLKIDSDGLQLVRLCLMNPFFTSKETKINYAEEFAANLAREIYPE